MRRTRWIALVLLPFVATACDWPMFMQNAAHTGTSSDTSITATDVSGSLVESWRATSERSRRTSITSSPVVANGVVYVGTSDGQLMAFDAEGRHQLHRLRPEVLFAALVDRRDDAGHHLDAGRRERRGVRRDQVRRRRGVRRGGNVRVPRCSEAVLPDLVERRRRRDHVVARRHRRQVFVGSNDHATYAFHGRRPHDVHLVLPVHRSRTAPAGQVISSPAVSGRHPVLRVRRRQALRVRRHRGLGL